MKSVEEKNQAMKLEIQRKLRQELGIIVDCPKQGESGNCNSGNTARVFFREKEKIGQLLDDKLLFPMELMQRLHTVLLCCSSKKYWIQLGSRDTVRRPMTELKP